MREAGLEALPFDDGAFDLILATDVLEHIERDDLAAASCAGSPPRDALLLVTVPAYRWLWSQHDDSHHHLRRYTQPELRARLAGAGWRPVLQTYFNALLLPPIALVRLLARRSRPVRTAARTTSSPRARSTARWSCRCARRRR